MQTKCCARCGQDRPLDQFGVNHRSADGHKSYCKPCETIYHREWDRRRRQLASTPALSNRELRQLELLREEEERQRAALSLERERERRKLGVKAAPRGVRSSANAAIIRDHKEHGRCAICGESRYACLDYHHRDPGTKRYNISAIHYADIPEEAVREELAKCVILCANCHRLLHAGVVSLP